jgi:predicted PurR-regulated permease PerM
LIAQGTEEAIVARRGESAAAAAPTEPVGADADVPTGPVLPAGPLRSSPTRGYLARGYVVTIGVFGGVLTAAALSGLRGIVFSIFIAMFAAVALNPLVRWFERRGVRRAWAIVIVIILIIAVLVAMIWVVLPVLVTQVGQVITGIPAEIERLKAEGWFDPTNEASNGVFAAVLNWIADSLKDPAVWTAIGTGVVGLGITIVSGVSTGFFIAILTIYFVGTYDATKQAGYKLVAKSHRAAFINYSERILDNIGRYLGGMVILAVMNAVFSTILLLVTGVPGAFLLGFIALFITIIPLIGTVLTTIAMSIVAFIHDPVSGLIVLIAMLIYMQVEAYVLGPRVLSKAVKVPGSVVLISALAGGTLFGLFGALVAIPISAGAILMIREVVVPRKELA